MSFSSPHQLQQQQLQYQLSSNGNSNSGNPCRSETKKKVVTPKAAASRPGGLLALDNRPAFSSVDDDYFLGVDEDPDPLVQRSPVAYQPLQLPIVHRPSAGRASSMSALFRALFPPLKTLLPTCQHLSLPSLPSRSMSLGRKRVTGTLFGQRRGRVTFAVQDSPSSEPLLLLELAVATGQLVKEMASGTVRVLLECERQPLEAHRGRNKKKHHQSPAPASSPAPPASLWEEPVWTMFCNGRRSGYAVSHPCGEADMHVLQAIRTVSAGAGVLPLSTQLSDGFPPSPAPPSSPFLDRGTKGAGPTGVGVDGGCSLEVMYMRARFERVVGSRDSEAFYMMSPDGGKAGGGSPELSIFLLRL
ncbi:hypothetical protein Taro_015913 [Colocasia esculenta]|uniref:Protein MIZU-KUSSEI 1 n=1 Tax=Colocasia esculenta TaxID=4460 RepID=A0A843UM57_COLES|nr:hypothetical protein [Colocasia esculenta]